MCYMYRFSMSCTGSGVPSVMCGGAHSTQQKVQTLLYMYYYYWVLLYSVQKYKYMYVHPVYFYFYKSRLLLTLSFLLQH